MKIFIGFVILLEAIRFTESACTFPTAFQNIWLTNSRGTWTVNSSTISNFPAQPEPSASALFNMDCHEIYSGYYVLRSQETVTPFSAQYNVYTCLYLEQQSDYSFIYSLLTQEFTVTNTPTTVIERITLGAVAATVTGASVCTDTAYTTAGERVHVALLNGSESLGKTECPSILQGHFNYLGTTCNSTSVDVCTDTKQLAFNTTACTQNTIYSQNGTLDCVYHNTIGSYTYVTVYNEDSSVDGSTYYTYSCLVVTEAGVYTYASVKPTECEANQVPTTSPTGGYVTVFEETAACITTSTSTEDLTYLYVIIGVIVLLIIITIIVLLICCIKCRKRLKDVESADDESDKGSEDSKSADDKPDEDDSKPEEGEEQQPSKTEEDKQSVDSGFIPGKDETKQKKKRKRRRRKRKKRTGDEGEEEEEEEDDGEEETSSENVAQPDESEDKSQPEQQQEETETDSASKVEETEVINQQPLAHTEEKDSESGDSHSQHGENVEPEPEQDQLSKKEESMETDNDSPSPNKPDTEPETQYKSNHSLEREGDDHHSQNEEGSDTEESEQETQSNNEKSVAQENNSSPRNDDGTQQMSPVTSRMEEDTKEENTTEKSDDDGSGTDGEEDDKDDDGVTLKDGKKIAGEKEGTNEDEDEEQGVQKKTGGKYIVPPGLLSKVLVTREMEEKSREKASRRKFSRRVGRIFAFKKSKKQGAPDENQDEEMNDPDMEDVDRQRFAQPVAPFMEQYNTKKDLEKKLDDAHYWDLPEDDNIVMQLDQIEEELEKEEQKEIEKMEVDVEVIGIENANENEGKKTTKEEANNVKDGEEKNSSRSSSRADSPQSKKVRKADSNSDLESDVFDLDDDCLPEGHIRNENGNIVRMADGKVYKPGQFQRHLKKARLKRIFNVPRLKRNKKGRPTGGMKDDTFGPEISVNDTAEQVDNEKNEREDGRISGNAQPSSDERKRTSESRRRSKTVAFSVAIGQFDQFGNPIEKEEQPRIDSSTVNRRKLRNRLFRKKKRRTEDLPPLSNSYGGNGPLINVPGADGNKPRELSNLVKVYGQPGTIPSTAPWSTLPPIGLARSNTSTFDKNQLQNFREGLSKDQQILEKTNTIGSNPLSQPLGVRRISVEDLSSEGGSDEDDEDVRNGNVELGSEDEFFLVGGPSQNEPLFTRVRPPPHSDLAKTLKSNHDQRHAIPWSILNAPPGRPTTDSNDLTKSLDAPRSADAIHRGMDDKRLRELLEELYKDKKYFDHVIDTTAPKENHDIDDRDLAEHGRDFLLDRADFWEDRGPLPSRPPRTSLGMRMSRMQTMIDSGRVSMTSTNTCTPPATELPNQMPLREENTFS